MLTTPKCPNCGNDMAALTYPWNGKRPIQIERWICPKCGWEQAPEGVTVEFDLNGGRRPMLEDTRAKMTDPKPCPNCGKLMVERRRPWILASDPAQEEFYWWCGCGREEFSRRRTIGRRVDEEQAARAEWEEANRPKTEVPHV